MQKLDGEYVQYDYEHFKNMILSSIIQYDV